VNEWLANLYGATGDADYLKTAEAFNQKKIFDPLARGEDTLNGLHANTQIPKMIGAARQYELTGDARDAGIATFFWQEVALHRSYVIGDHSDREHFFPTNDFAKHLSAETAETCNTYNMLKLTRHLFGWSPDAGAMDFYERALYNDILASQDPEQGMFVYLMSLKPGHFKTYSTPEDSFWCCVGTGMENHAKYGDTIYFHNDDSLFVNLFIPSELSWPEKRISVRQETKFPESDTTRLDFQTPAPTQLALKIRWPAWVEKISVRVNGKKQKMSGAPGSYVSLNREWRNGDRVEIRLPMTLHTEPLPGTTNIVALLYGPIVLAGNLGTNGMPSPYARDQLDLAKIPDPEVPVFVSDQKTFLKKNQGDGRTAGVPDKKSRPAGRRDAGAVLQGKSRTLLGLLERRQRGGLEKQSRANFGGGRPLFAGGLGRKIKWQIMHPLKQPAKLLSGCKLSKMRKNSYEFSWQVKARPLKEGDGKGADRGVDGFLKFY
jgi:hypothetical protein